ncbi:MAG: hypothetical protein HYY22_05135 [Thaumarchaeota archaeon]|nr:hypothetical protein [Nitrososphaerota archaeon]
MDADSLLIKEEMLQSKIAGHATLKPSPLLLEMVKANSKQNIGFTVDSAKAGEVFAILIVLTPYLS